MWIFGYFSNWIDLLRPTLEIFCLTLGAQMVFVTEAMLCKVLRPGDGKLPSHTALAVMDYLAKHRAPTLPQPPYSPDVASPDFFLFPRLKRVLKGRHHGSVQAIQEAVTKELKSIPVFAFEGVFRDAEGSYFENY